MAHYGYFELENKSDGLYLKIVPADNGGNVPDFGELIRYCDAKNIQYESVVQLRTAFEAASTGELVRIGGNITPFAGWCDYIISTDLMKVTAIMYPAVVGMPEVDVNEVMTDLKNRRIKFGIMNDNISSMINEKKYFIPIDISIGQAPIDGYDAELTYNFNTEISSKPQINDDGTVDFHKLDLINKVNEGDVVAQIKPEDPGKPGMDVHGSVIKPKKVYRKTFKYSKNLRVSEDGLKLISLVTGHVSLQDEKIFVSDEYEIATDVNNGTGDIDFDGNVHIRGNVLAGFKVKAGGNIVVDGVVEGAEITAGGDIILQRGIQGMNKGVLTAGGNIASNFIENATVKAGKDIDTDAIMHSKVTARGNIEVHGRNGYLIGGYVRAGNMITAKTIGSEMGTNTIVGVGTDPELVMQTDNLKKQITKSAKDKEQLSQVITMLRKKQELEGKLEPDKVEMLQKAMKNIILLENSIKEMKNEYGNLSALLVENDNARVKITGSIYPGTKIEIGDISFFVRDKNNFCQYVRKGAEITRINL